MAPNLNKEKVQVKQQMLREASRDQAAIARARDKAALDKQRSVDSCPISEHLENIGLLTSSRQSRSS
jgi:hypothetical protein